MRTCDNCDNKYRCGREFDTDEDEFLFASICPDHQLNKSITNFDYIKSLSPEELAKLLVKTVELSDDTYHELLGFCIKTTTYYFTPNDKKFLDIDDAIEETVKWLEEER